ncbi:hypothetical protein FAI40_09625 [Acetobacteraceae bacterium]|nr:hypothetical protein FAI40_09625 [Acetobacteraceae bacterium]
MIQSSFLRKYLLLFSLGSFLATPILLQASVANAADDNSHGPTVRLYWKKEEIYDRNAHTVTLTGGARGIRNNITLDADTIIGYLRKKVPLDPVTKEPIPQPESEDDGDQDGDQDLYRIEAIGHVHIYNQKDQAWGDHGIYDLDKGIMLLTGNKLRVVSAKNFVTARDLLEYYPDTHISIGRGDAIVTTSDGKRFSADVVKAIGYSDEEKERLGPDAPDLDRAYGWGDVTVRTPTRTAVGDRGVYLFGPELARLMGHVRVTKGQNQNNGSQAIVNMKTGISRMLPGGEDPVQGLIVPNENAS